MIPKGTSPPASPTPRPKGSVDSNSTSPPKSGWASASVVSSVAAASKAGESGEHTATPARQQPNTSTAGIQSAGASTATTSPGPSPSSPTMRLPPFAAQFATVSADSSIRPASV